MPESSFPSRHRAAGVALALAAVGVVAIAAPTASAVNYVTAANGVSWSIDDGAAPAIDTGSIRNAGAAVGFGGIRVRVRTAGGDEPPRGNGELVRGYGLRFDGREDFRTTTPVPLGDIAVGREIHVERAGNWARWTDAVTNHGRTSRTVDISFGGVLGDNVTAGRMARVAATSSGDTTVGPDDAWAVVARPNAAATSPTSGPSAAGPVATVLGAPAPFPGALIGTGNIGHLPFLTPLPTVGNEANQHGYNRTITVPAGKTVRVVHFVVVGLSETLTTPGAPVAGSQIAAVTATAQALTASPDLDGLTVAQICSIVNFDVTTTPISGFDPADCATVADPSIDPAPKHSPARTTSAYDVVDKTIGEMLEDLEAGRTTSQEITRAYLDRIAAYDVGPWGIHSFISIAEDAMAQARRADERRAAGADGALLGIPVAVKDNYDTKDQPTTAGSLTLEDYRPTKDAFQVARMRAAGAVILGKTNLSEYAYNSWGDSGFGSTWNAFFPSKTPMGSSSGSGTAVAGSMAGFAMGTDTFGSLVQPAAAGSLATIRTTLGLTSRGGVLPNNLFQDAAGPLTRSVGDLARVLNVTAGSDAADPATADADTRRPTDFESSLDPAALRGKRIGYVPTMFTDVARGTTRASEAAIARLDVLRAAGADVVTMPAPPMRPALAAGTTGSTLIDGYDEWVAEHPDAGITSGLALRNSPRNLPYNRGTTTLVGLSDEGRDAHESRRKAYAGLLEAWMEDAGVDAVVYPPNTGDLYDNDVRLYEEGGNLGLSAYSGLPVVEAPSGTDAYGEPNGMQFLGRAWHDAELIGYAYAFEQQDDGHVAPAVLPALPYDADATPRPIVIDRPEPPVTPAPAPSRASRRR